MYVRESQLPQGGEGLYARRDFGVKEVAALYNGIKFKSSTYAADHAQHILSTIARTIHY